MVFAQGLIPTVRCGPFCVPTAFLGCSASILHSQNSSVPQPWELLSLQQPGHSWPQFVKCPLSTWLCISQRVKGTSAALSPLYASLSQTTISNAASMPSLVVPSLYNGSGNCLQVARRGVMGFTSFIFLPSVPSCLCPNL